MPLGDVARFTVQRIVDALNTVEIMVTEPPFQQKNALQEGSLFGALLCPVQTYPPLEPVHVDFTSIEMTMELNKPPSIKNVLVLTDQFHEVCHGFRYQRSENEDCHAYHVEQFIAVFGAPRKLLSDRGVNFTSALVEKLCSVFWHPKVWNGHVSCIMQWTSGKISPDIISNDQKISRGQQGSMGASPLQAGAGL